MKTLTTLLVTSTLAIGSTHAVAQWTDVLNSNIHFEYNVQDNGYWGDNDGDGTADPVINTNVNLVGVGDLGWQCYNWQGPAGATNQGCTQWWAGSTGFNNHTVIQMETWESDAAVDCTYDPNLDDWHWSGYATLRDGIYLQKIVYPSTDFYPCNWNANLGNAGSGWLFPECPWFDRIMRCTWRYQAGDGPTNMLDFGTVAMNTTKADINSNRSVATASGLPLQYENLWGDPARDVFYKFHIDQPSTVIISTDDSNTNFDTKIHLFHLNGGTLIATDDDGGTTGSTSLLNLQLCAGDYEIITEGYSSNTGVFKLSVTVQAPVAPTIAMGSVSGVTCFGATDGMATWGSSGGAGIVSYWLDGTNLGSATSATDLNEGTHTVQVVDECGTTASVDFQVVNNDVVPPVALCLATLEVDVADGVPAEFNTLDGFDINNGSTDNCAIQSYAVDPALLTVDDVGFNTMTLTVVDFNGNSSSCTCQVYAVNVTGIDENTAKARIRVVPNPSDGHYRMDLSELALSSKTQLTVLDPLGRTVFTTNPNRAVLDMDLGHLPNGTYMVRLNDPQWDASTRIVLQH